MGARQWRLGAVEVQAELLLDIGAMLRRSRRTGPAPDHHPLHPCPPPQVLSTAARVGVPMSGENALQRYDQWAFDKICDSAFGQSVMAGRLEVGWAFG